MIALSRVFMFKRIIYFSFFVTAAVVIAFMLVAKCLVPRPYSFNVPDAALKTNAELSLAVEFIAADPILRTFTMDWYPLLPPRCDYNITKVVDIYLDPGILDATDPEFAVLPPYNPVYRHILAPRCSRSSNSTFHAFRTTTKLLSSDLRPGSSGPQSSSIQNYPFDVYFAPFYLYALEGDNGRFVKLNITRSFGNIVNFDIKLQVSGEEIAGGWLYYTLRLTRSKVTKIFVVVTGLTNWLTAIAFLIICVSTIIYPSHKIYGEMFVVPAGAVFATTAIRSGFPGAPSGFGATIDIYTILPVLIVMSLCSFFLLLIILHRRIAVFGE